MESSSSSRRLRSNSNSPNDSSRSCSTNTPPKAPPNEPQGTGGLPVGELPARPKIPVLTFNIKEVQETFDKRITARERGRERGLVRQSALPHIHRIAMKDLPRALRRVQQSLPRHDVEAANTIIAHAKSLIVDPASHVIQDFSGDAALSPDVRQVMECVRATVANHDRHGADAEQERRCMLIDWIGAVFSNGFRSNAGRVAANAFNVTVRTGLVMLLAKLIQDAVAFEVNKAAMLGGEEGSLRIAGILALTLAPTLNVLGGILSGALGTANPTSVISRLWLGMLYLGLLLACYETDMLASLALKLSPVGIYCLIRDGLNFWFTFNDNVGSVSTLGVGLSGGIYSLLNAFAGVVIGKTVPTAGAGALPRAVNETERMTREHLAAVANAVPDVRASVGNAIMYAGIEIADDVVLPTILRWIQTREYRKKEALNMQDEAAHSEYIDELKDSAKKLLKTPRKERQRMIDDLNLDLYRREFKRMTKLGNDHQLDEAHKQYLESLRKELLVYQQTKNVRAMWTALSEDPNCYRADQLAQLKSMEVALGVYQKTRELDRLKSLDAGWIVKEQSRDLAALQDEVDRDLETWNDLRSKDQSLLNDDEKELLRQLASEFVSDIDLKPARLRPIPRLHSDARDTPDFTRFAQRIRNTCRLHADLTPKERADIVEELFVYEFVRLHLPGSGLTRVEQDVLASISEEKPKILPSELLEQLKKDVAEERRQATEGIRIGVGFLPANVSSVMEAVERLGRQLLVTDAARQSAIGSVYALLALMTALMGDRIKDTDENAQLTIWNLTAGFGIFMVYWALIMMHSEGARRGGVYRPGAESTLPPLQARQTPEEPYTPRTERYRPDDRAISETDSDYIAESESESDEVVELGPLSLPRVWAE